MTGPRAQGGYSLVELMIAVAIIAIMAAIGIPSFKAIIPRIRLNNNVMLLSNEIALTRVRAISKSTDFRIVFDTASDSYTTAKYQGGAWQSLGTTKLSGSNLNSVGGLRGDIVACGSQPGAFATPETLVLCGGGQANIQLNSQAVIEVSSPDGLNRKQVVVEPTGRMFVQKWSGSGWVQD